MIHCYKLNGFNIVLDTASGSIHSVDDVAFDVISMYENADADELVARIRQRYRDDPDITDDEVHDIISDVETLRLQKKLFSPDTFADVPERMKNSVTPLKALCLNVAHTCNMSCAYCFAGSGEYGGGEGLMPLETGKRAIDFLIENSGSRKNLEVDFFGGEPLLNWDVVKGIVEYARKVEGSKNFRFTLTTNGLLIDDDVIGFTNREMHNVVLSLDGRPETHDRLRKLTNGSGSYGGVLPKLKQLVESRGGKGYYIRGTFTRKNLDFTSDILHMAELGFTELSIEPVVAKPPSPFALTQDDLPVIFEQYELLASEMLRREKAGRGFTFYHYMLDLDGGPCIYKRIAGCGSGTEYLAVTPSGELYPCHQFVGDSAFLMGDVWHGVTNTEVRREFAGCDIYSRPECRECWARLYCSGGCAANAYNAAGSIGSVYSLGCELFKKRVECAIMIKVAHSMGN